MTNGLIRSTDWNFAGSRPEPDFHPYPCRFIAEIPGKIIDLTAMDGPILDPFCGSGTTLVEAVRRGHHAVGVDLNPVACLISRVKLQPWLPEDAELGPVHAAGLLEAGQGGTDNDVELIAQNIPRVDHWFEPWTQRLIAGALRYVTSVDPLDPWRDRLAVSLSASVVRLGRQESDTRYAAVEKNLSADDGLKTLEASFERVVSWLRDRQPPMRGVGATVTCGDARDLSAIGEGSIGGAIFSPPYPNAYEYWLYHKYRMYWLGFDPTAVREEEIGARPHYSKPNGLTGEDFARQMKDVFAELGRVLRPGALGVVVVGDSIIRGEHVNNGDLLVSTAETTGFRLLDRTSRDIRQGSFNKSHARARNSEHILVFKSS